MLLMVEGVACRVVRVARLRNSEGDSLTVICKATAADGSEKPREARIGGKLTLFGREYEVRSVTCVWEQPDVGRPPAVAYELSAADPLVIVRWQMEREAQARLLTILEKQGRALDQMLGEGA